MQAIQKTGAAFAVFLLVASLLTMFYVFATPGNHSEITVTEGAPAASSDASVVAYESLTDADQETFREAVTDGESIMTTTPTDTLDSLPSVDAVTLDGVTYSVTIEDGKYPFFLRASGVFAVIAFVYSGLLAHTALEETDTVAYNVIVGSWFVLFACFIALFFWSLASLPFGSTVAGVSPTPVSEDVVGGDRIVQITSLSGAEREAMYEAVDGGGERSVQSQSVTAVPEVPLGVVESYAYVQSDSEFYALTVVSDYQQYMEAFLFIVLHGVAVVFGVTGVGTLTAPVYRRVRA